MKAYLLAVLWVVVAIGTYGLGVPALVSYPDDLLVIVGMAIGTIMIPVLFILGRKAIAEIRRKLSV